VARLLAAGLLVIAGLSVAACGSGGGGSDPTVRVAAKFALISCAMGVFSILLTVLQMAL
jgi:hypothetical protein